MVELPELDQDVNELDQKEQMLLMVKMGYVACERGRDLEEFIEILDEVM